MRVGPGGLFVATLIAVGLSAAAPAARVSPVDDPDRAASQLPRTVDGRPDLQGIWNNSTQTPFQRPAALGTKQFYTDEELATLRLHDHDSDRLANGDPGTYNQFWWEEG